MKLLLENWRKYSAEINENSNAGAVYLFENKKPVKTEFSVLIENYDNGSLTTDQLIETWEKSFDYELSLLEEGKMDKISDWVHTKSVQLWQLLQKGKEAGLKAVQSYAGMAAKFKKKHPKISRAATVVAMSAALFLLIQAVEDPQAMAALEAGGKPLDERWANMLKNAATDVAMNTARDGDLDERMKAAKWAMEAVEVINDAMASSTVEQLEAIPGRAGSLIKNGWGYIQDLREIANNPELPIEERQWALKTLQSLEKTQNEFIKNY